MSGSVREYAILYVGAGKPGASGGGAIGGGNAITKTAQHALDGFEHTAATTDPTRLDASSTRHGLLPKLSGDAGDVLRGDGTFAPESVGAANPMTAVGDLIVGGTVTGGVAAPARLAIGSATTVLHGGTTPAYTAVLPADLDVSADNTTANATSGHHGLLPKLSGSATDALRGDGSWGAAASHVYAPLTASDGSGGFVLVFAPTGDCIMV